MNRNIKFITIFVSLFLLSCSTQDNSKSSKSDINAPYSDTNVNFKYNSMYNKLVVELLLHKNQYDEAIETFSTNIQYFRDEDDFLKMINPKKFFGSTLTTRLFPSIAILVVVSITFLMVIT